MRHLIRGRRGRKKTPLTAPARSALAVVLLLATVAPALGETPQTATVVVRSGAPAYFSSGRTPDRIRGMDHDLIQLLKRRENIRLKVVTVETAAQALEMLRAGDADLAAGHLALAPQAAPDLVALPAYASVTHQIIQHYSEQQPSDWSQVPCESLEVGGHPGHRHAVSETARGGDCPPLVVHKDIGARAILRLVDQGLIGYAPADNGDILVHQHRYPRLKVAFDLPGSIPVAWFASERLAPDLRERLTRFFKEINAEGLAQRIRDRYFQHIRLLEYGAKLTFMRKANTSLKKHIRDFIRTANLFGLDWRLLAAISYKESHWNAKAVSPSHAKGLMMLTKPIARQHDIDDRFDASKNIIGGARYLVALKNRLPESIEEPDRTWFTIAAYNIGLRYVLNARTLAQKAGKNPDWWMHVRDHLSDARKASDAPVRLNAQTYVYTVLRYRDLLRWLDDDLMLFQSDG